MAVFGFMVLYMLALGITFAILFGICYGGEEFSNTGFIPTLIGISVIFTIWVHCILTHHLKL